MERYTEFDGGYLDAYTGLIWKSHTEEGVFTFEQALQLEDKEWRLPTIKELYSIVDTDVYNPATKLYNHTSGYYWSGTVNSISSYCAWMADFFTGTLKYDYRNEGNYVRLIRR